MNDRTSRNINRQFVLSFKNDVNLKKNFFDKYCMRNQRF